MTTLIGTNPDQVPVNSMLGGMAYQDPDSINVKDLRYSGMLTGIGSSSISSSAGDISSTVHADNATGGAILILKAGNGSTSSYYSYIRIINNDSSPKTWDIGTRGNDSLHIFDGTTSRMVVSSSVDYVQFNSGNTSFFIGNGATAGGGTTDDTSFNWSLSGAVKLCRNSTIVAEIDTDNNLVIKTTGALKISEGTTAQRPASPQEGMIRKNSTLGVIEGYSEGGYVSLEAGRLINVRLFKDAGVHSSFSIDPKTEYAIVEMVGGGGGGGQTAPGPYATDGFVNIASSGGAGIALRFLLRKPDLQATMYYRVGQGGAAGGPGGTGGEGEATVLSKTPTNAGLSSYIQANGGEGGERTAIAAAPLGSMSASVGGYLQNGINAQILEIGRPRGVTMTLLNNSHSGVIVQGSVGVFELNTVHSVGWAYHDNNIDGSGTVFSFGAGGEGTYAFRNDTPGSYYSGSAFNGFKGMIRIYEYS